MEESTIGEARDLEEKDGEIFPALKEDLGKPPT